MTTTSAATPREETNMGAPKAKFRRARSRSIILDTVWAKALGVGKTAGAYRIRSDELQARLFLMQEVPGFSASTTEPLTHDAIVSRHNLEILTTSGKTITS
jgi:hypothetical protein